MHIYSKIINSWLKIIPEMYYHKNNCNLELNPHCQVIILLVIKLLEDTGNLIQKGILFLLYYVKWPAITTSNNW
jgi:hypothetical protein